MYWYEEEVKRLENKVRSLNSEPRVVFYGSSSIRLWGENLKNDFKNYNTVNLGFGGSTLAACDWFFDRVVAPVNASAVIVYAGDNDLGDGRCPEEVFIFFKQLLFSVRKQYGNIPFGFISVKPSLHRWNIVERISHTNRLIEQEMTRTGGNQCFIDIYDKMIGPTGFPIEDLFSQPDGLHLNAKGYALWKEVIDSYVADGRLLLTAKELQF